MLDEDAGVVGRKADDAKADAETGSAGGIIEVSDFQNFLVNEVGDAVAAGGDAEAAFVAVQSGEFLVVLGEHIEALKAGRAAHGPVALDGDGDVGVEQGIGIEERTAFKSGTGGTCFEIVVTKGEEDAGLEGFGEIDKGTAVGKPHGVAGVLDETVRATGAGFAAIVLDGEGVDGVFGFSRFVENGRGEELSKEIFSAWGPAKGVHDVGEGLSATEEFFALEDAATLAAGFLDPDIVVLEVVLLGLKAAIYGVNDAAIGGKGEGGDFVVDGLQRLIDFLGLERDCGRREKDQQQDHEQKEGADGGVRVCAAEVAA